MDARRCQQQQEKDDEQLSACDSDDESSNDDDFDDGYESYDEEDYVTNCQKLEHFRQEKHYCYSTKKKQRT